MMASIRYMLIFLLLKGNSAGTEDVDPKGASRS